MASEEIPEWPRVLILDANVYLNLAKVPGNTPVLRAIEKTVRKGTVFRLIIPEPVVSAVKDHRDEAIEGYWRIRREALNSMKSYLSDLAPEPDALRELAKRIDERIRTIEKQLPDTVAAMDGLMAAGTVVNCEPAHFEDAGQRFMAKRAPAHERAGKGRQHISIFKDCLIWAITKEHASKGAVEFVTADKDFTSPTHNEKLHEELEAELASARLKFHTLDDFLKVHVNDAPSVVQPPSTEWPWPRFTKCPACGSDAILPDLVPGPSQYGGWSYRQYCPGHGGYVDTGEPYDE